MVEPENGDRAIEIERGVLELHCFPRDLCLRAISPRGTADVSAHI
jgi:hypothetical protein